MRKFSVLELLHPDGIAHTSLVLGSHCPEILRPELGQNLNETIDFLILAPSDEECSAKEWLAAALRTIHDRLSADGIAYLLLPPRWRWKGVSLLNKTGLVMDTVFLHFPDVSSSRYLIPLQRFPGQFTIHTILSSPSLKRKLASQMFRYEPTRWFLTHLHESIGISVRKPGARPLFEWLFRHQEHTLPTTAIVRKSWRARNGATIVYGFSGRDTSPAVIAKVGATPSREAQVLEELSPATLHAGVRVPEIIGEQQNDQASSLLLSFIAGASVSDLLVSNPGIYSQVMTKTVDWLERWHRATVILRPLQPEQFEQFLFTPLNQLAPLLQNASNYRDRLITCSEKVSGTLAPRVAAHNDLTMANLLLDDHGQLGVVDWETACPDGLPFTDFYYAVTDAVRIATRCANWLDAFKACYLPEGSHYANVSAWHARLRSAAAPPPGYAEYCFHACWLHHASNEHKTSQPGEPRPFLEVVQWLALHESTFDQINN